MTPNALFLLPATLVALPLSLAADLVGIAFDRYAAVAEPISEFLAETAETARWVACASRVVP